MMNLSTGGALQQAFDSAEKRYGGATDSTQSAARRELIAAAKALAHAQEPGHGASVENEQWSHQEVDAANQVLRARNLPNITREDTAFWYIKDGHKRMTFYATPACPWGPAIIEAASIRIQNMKKELGDAVKVELAPPFVVMIMAAGSAVICVPECVVDLYSNAAGLRAGNTLGFKGLVPMPAAMFGYSG